MMEFVDNLMYTETGGIRNRLVALALNVTLVLNGKRLAYYDDNEFPKEISESIAHYIKSKLPELTIMNINSECYAPLIFLSTSMNKVLEIVFRSTLESKDALGEILGYKYTLNDWSSPDIPKYNIEYCATKDNEEYHITAFLCPISYFTEEVKNSVKNDVLLFRETLSPLGYYINARVRVWTGNRMLEVVDERLVA